MLKQILLCSTDAKWEPKGTSTSPNMLHKVKIKLHSVARGPTVGWLSQMQKLRAALVGAQNYQRFPLSEPVVGQNIALHAVSAYRVSSTYLVSAFLAHSTSFSPKFLQSSTVEYVFSSESEFLLMVGIHFVSPYDPLLTLI